MRSHAGPCLTLKVKALHSFKTPVSTDTVTKCHISEGLTGRSNGCENPQISPASYELYKFEVQ